MTFAFLLVAALVAGALSASAIEPTDNPVTYTYDDDFDLGTLVNVNHDPSDQLQLDEAAEPFNFIWVAVSSEGTVVKIDTTTGAVLGEYRTTPSSHGFGNPSRTTVDNDGSVWVANRNNVSDAGFGTIVHIGLEENGQCEDRDNSGTIDTSMGLGSVLGWADDSGTRGVATAVDECIVHYTEVNSKGTRHVSVDAENDVWVSGVELANFDLVEGGRYDVPNSGTIIRSETAVGYGGYGGLIDGYGVIWSAQQLLRWDAALPLIAGNFTGYDHDSYGLCIDSGGNVWNTALFGDQIRKFAPDGTLLGTYSHGNEYAQGCVVDGNDHVWVAHSLLEFPGGQNTVGHILNDGTYIGNVGVGNGPTGVAVDAAGKIWATNYHDGTASRIDPALGGLGADGATIVGAVDFTTVYLGGNLYNYSDMTGSTLFAPPTTGTWTVIRDSGVTDAPWSMVSWNADELGDSSLVVEVASSTDGVTFSAPEVVASGTPLVTTPAGQYLKVTVSFQRATTDESPVLYDITLVHNRPPVADPNGPYLFPLEAGPFDGSGSSDPDGDPLTYAWTFGDGNTGTGMEPFNTYVEAGIYDVCLNVYDGLAYSDEVCTTAVIYDPDGGFVTGGGWIDSPAGAYYPSDLPFFDGSYYEIVVLEHPLTFAEAREAAEAMTYGTCESAHLATITTQGEYDAVLELFDEWHQAELGGYQDADELVADEGWEWVTGEEFDFEVQADWWLPGEPNDCGESGIGGCVPGSEQVLQMYPDGWNDVQRYDALSMIYPMIEYEGCDLGPTGKATFGFVSKYKKGAKVPTGNTEFQFKSGDLNFHSTSYDWLVVTGSDYARYKGVGTINGEGEYKFMIWAGDDTPDTFRIKIWTEDGDGVETVIYDNGHDQAIGAGSIVIHTKNK